MAAYAYRGRDEQGQLVTGVLEAESTAACARILIGRGINPVVIEPYKPPSGQTFGLASTRWLPLQKPKLEDLIFFWRQMFTLSRSGVPLTRGIAGLAETTRNPSLAMALADIIRQLEGGYSLSLAFSRHGKIFPPMVIGILQVGETTGRVDEAFLQLAAYLEREFDMRERIKTATRYPVMVLVAIGIALGVINLLVIPAFAKLFGGLKAELPWATKVLLACSNFAVDYWPAVLGGLASSAWLWQRFLRTPQGRLWWDRVKLRLPVIGPILTKIVLARFCRSFSSIITLGVPLIQGMGLLAESMGNVYMDGLIKDLRRGIERGDSVSHTIRDMKVFPPLMLQMIAVGEETGRLDQMLGEVADFYDREADYDLKNLSTAIEPVLLVILTGMVLILALGVYLPMWDLSSAAGVRH